MILKQGVDTYCVTANREHNPSCEKEDGDPPVFSSDPEVKFLNERIAGETIVHILIGDHICEPSYET